MLNTSLLIFTLISIGTCILREADAENTDDATNGMYYFSGNDVTYTQKSIINHLREVSLIQCLMDCGRVVGCTHIAFDGLDKHCSLLRGVINNNNNNKNNDNNNTNNEKIYSLLPGESHMLS